MLCVVITTGVLLTRAITASGAELPNWKGSRLDRLERIINGLEQWVRQLESGRSVVMKQPGDPLWGNWQPTAAFRLQSRLLDQRTGSHRGDHAGDYQQGPRPGLMRKESQLPGRCSTKSILTSLTNFN